jgi:hypothetical protein
MALRAQAPKIRANKLMKTAKSLLRQNVAGASPVLAQGAFQNSCEQTIENGNRTACATSWDDGAGADGNQENSTNKLLQTAKSLHCQRVGVVRPSRSKGISKSHEQTIENRNSNA